MRIQKLLILAAALALPAIASAQYYTGKSLADWMNAYERIQNGGSDTMDLARATSYSGYVTGVADLQKMMQVVCPRDGVTVSQLVALVSQFIEAHPEHWDRNAAAVVSGALREAFPCTGTGGSQ